MTTNRTPNTPRFFELSTLIAWGYETGGDLDEAIRLHCEHDDAAEPTEAEYQKAQAAFQAEFAE